jgi:pimeloyl-ACP methyl ester carboxylesterase
MRARYPDHEGYVERNEVRVHYEVFGEGELTVLFLPTSSLVHSQIWKSQVPYLARHCRVITFDGRGNGKSDRPTDSEQVNDIEWVRDALAVLNETGLRRRLSLVSPQERCGRWLLLRIMPSA